MNKTYLNINNTFLVIFGFFPFITLFLPGAIFFYFAIGICWVGILIYRDSLTKTATDFCTYVFNNRFSLFLGIFAIYIIFNFYFISPYKSPTIWLQFFPFHVTSLFGLFLLYNTKENFSDRVLVAALSSTFIIYIALCIFSVVFKISLVTLEGMATGEILRSMSPPLLPIISCLLAMEIHRNSQLFSQKIIVFLYASIGLINFFLVFLSHGNVTKLIFLTNLVIIILSLLFKKSFFPITIGILLGIILLPVGLSKLKDFTFLNTKTFSVQVRSIQTRIPQWIKVCDFFPEKPITGHGVYASYFMEDQSESLKEETLVLDDILEKNFERREIIQQMQNKLDSERVKILEDYFLVEKTNHYYSLQSHISDPSYYEKFIEELKIQSQKLERMLEIFQGIKLLEEEKDLLTESNNLVNNQVKFAKMDQTVKPLELEKLLISKAIEDYNTADTVYKKKQALQKELTRFLDYPHFKITNHPHNIFLQVLLELGMVGLVMLVSLLLFILYKISQIEDLFYRTIGCVLFFTFVIIYSTANSIWYIGMHQTIYIVAFLFILIKQNDFVKFSKMQENI